MGRKATNSAGAPVGREGHTAIWADTMMIIWGGVVAGGAYTNTGARYNPVTDTWSPLGSSVEIEARALHNAVCTPTHMMIWGGGLTAGLPRPTDGWIWRL